MAKHIIGVMGVSVTKKENEIIDGDLVDPNLFILTFHGAGGGGVKINLERPLFDDLLVELVSVLNGEDFTPLCIIDCNETECKHCKDGKCMAGTITLTQAGDPIMSPIRSLLACQQAGHADGKEK